MTKQGKFQKGDAVTFTGLRLTSGNPVKGVFVKEDDESITVELLNDISGLNNDWYKGETRDFRKSLIYGLKSL